MKEIKAEAKRHHAHKLHKYGGHATHGHAHGGLAHHPDLAEDKALIHQEVKPAALKHHLHKAGGGPILGGRGPALGRRRPGGKGKTNVNVVMATKPDGAGAGAPMLPPLPVGGGLPIPPAAGPRPVLPPRAPIGAGPAGPGPMKRGGAAKHHGGHHLKHHAQHHGRHH